MEVDGRDLTSLPGAALRAATGLLSLSDGSFQVQPSLNVSTSDNSELVLGVSLNFWP